MRTACMTLQIPSCFFFLTKLIYMYDIFSVLFVTKFGINYKYGQINLRKCSFFFFFVTNVRNVVKSSLVWFNSTYHWKANLEFSFIIITQIFSLSCFREKERLIFFSHVCLYTGIWFVTWRDILIEAYFVVYHS